MSISMVAEKKTPTEIRMRAAMSARIQMMLKRHPKITTYYKLEAAAKVSSTCLRNMRDGNKQNIYGLSLTNAYKIATALDISLAELVSSPEEFFDKAQVPLPQSIEDLRECIADKLRMLMYCRTETNTSRKLTIASGVDERAIRRALGKADDYVPTLTTMAGLADFFQVPLSAFFIPPIGEVGVDEPPRASEMFSIEVLKSRLRASRAGAGLKIGEMAEKLNVKSQGHVARFAVSDREVAQEVPNGRAGAAMRAEFAAQEHRPAVLHRLDVAGHAICDSRRHAPFASLGSAELWSSRCMDFRLRETSHCRGTDHIQEFRRSVLHIF